MADYVPYRDAWPRYRVPARPNDRAEGGLWSDVRADELTGYEYEGLPPDVRAEVDADLAAMDAAAEACGVDDPARWRDGEAMVRRTDPPMAAE
jgi:hypothetical protein